MNARPTAPSRPLSVALALVEASHAACVPPLTPEESAAVAALASRVTWLRSLTRWTRAELARRAGLTPNGVAHVEHADHRVRRSTLERLARGFAGDDDALSDALLDEFLAVAGPALAAEAVTDAA